MKRPQSTPREALVCEGLAVGGTRRKGVSRHPSEKDEPQEAFPWETQEVTYILESEGRQEVAEKTHFLSLFKGVEEVVAQGTFLPGLCSPGASFLWPTLLVILGSRCCFLPC